MMSRMKAIAVAIAVATSALVAPGANAQEASPTTTIPAPPPTDAPAAVPAAEPAVAAPPHAAADNAVRIGRDAPVPNEGAPPAVAKPVVPEWLQSLTLGGGVLAWYYQPLGISGAQNNVSLYFANLLIDGKWGIFGLHFEPRFRDTKLRNFYASPVWLQEAYASVDLGPTQLRIGKEYSQFGLFWDNSFYGNVQVYDGLKLDPDFGLSLQGNLGKKDDAVDLGFYAQYFVIDGSTNVSLDGRDTFSLPGARRRNQAVARVEPRLHLGDATIAVGASGEFFQAADLPGVGTQNVWRAAGDAKLTAGKLGVWGEYTHQDGQSVVGFPVAGAPATATTPASPGGASSSIDYVLGGVEYTVGPVTARYNVSLGSYTDVSVKEWLHVPAIGVAVSPNLSFLGEVVFWRRDKPTGDSFVDRSFNLTMSAHL